MAELEEIIRLVEQSLDEPGLDAGEPASRACLSRFHFGRPASAAFFRAYGTTPTGYRRQRRPVHDLQAANGIHFHPPGGLRLPATHRSDTMDVLTRMSDHHVELTGAIIDPGAGDPMQFAGGEGSDASGITRNFE